MKNKRRIIFKESILGRYFRLVIPGIDRSEVDAVGGPMAAKKLVVQRLGSILVCSRHLVDYLAALETHPVTGSLHFDCLLVFSKRVRLYVSVLDSLWKHGDLTKYRSLNASIVDYGRKEDPDPLGTIRVGSDILFRQQLKRDPYGALVDRMREDPFNFNLADYCRLHGLDKEIRGWSSVKSKLRDFQQAECNARLRDKPGFRIIDDALISQVLLPSEVEEYYSWTGYSRIVSYLNSIISAGFRRPFKTLNLLITGPPSIGKTSLFHNPHHSADRSCVQDFCAVYPMGMTTWFPHYRSGVYGLILWNQAKLTSYSYDTILKLLEGSYLDLPTKGGVAPKRDNPLIVMTSNMTLQQMICQKFKNLDYRAMARRNLAVRIQNVVVPEGRDLFLLQRLLVVR